MCMQLTRSVASSAGAWRGVVRREGCACELLCLCDRRAKRVGVWPVLAPGDGLDFAACSTRTLRGAPAVMHACASELEQAPPARGFRLYGGGYLRGGPRRVKGGHFVDEHLDDGGVCHRGNIAQRLRLAARDLSQNAAHDFPRARLGQPGHAHDHLGRGDAADVRAHRALELSHQLDRVVVAVGQDAVGEDAHSLDVVRHAHHGRLDAGRVHHQRRLDLRSPQAMA
mmetsp:Transcript_23202/g.58857  ORF Transcript_23202/g.58857 Transcript_23202/m.58857 type:complete len:226 (-) Transcript_23202:20-697(-)